MARVATVVALLALAGNGPAAETKRYVCFSMQAAERAIRDGAVPEEIARLGHMSRVVGLLVDPDSHDCVLVGERDASRAALHLEDLVVLLRSTYLHRRWEAPGVTINPRRDEAGMFRQGDQEVVYFGHIERTRCGKVCFEADVLMKRIGLGLVRPRVPQVKPYFDLTVAALRQAAERARATRRPEDVEAARVLASTEVCSRFWYYPVVSRVVTVGNGVLLARCELAVLPQVLAVRRDGRVLENVEDFHHNPSTAFAESFSAHFDELSREWDVIRDLEGIASLSAVVRGLAKTDAKPVLDYWLRRFPVEAVDTPASYPIQKNTDRTIGFSVFGGVHLHALSVRLKEGDLRAFSEAVLEGKRRANGAVTWSIVLTPGKDLYVAARPDEDPQAATEYWVRGEYLFQAGKLDEAIANWRQVVRLYPDLGEAYYRIAQAFERKGLVDAAADYYTRALEADPFFRNLEKLR